MPDTELLTDQQIAEIEARKVNDHHLANGAYIGCYIFLSTSERDSLIATVKQLREQLFEEQARNQTQADSIMDAESEITSLQSQLEQLRAENERLRRQIEPGEKSDVFSDEYAALGHDEKETL